MPRSGDEDGSTSICTQPVYAPIFYHWYGPGAHSKVIPAVRALIDSISMPHLDKERLKGEMTARFIALKRGDLLPIRHVIGPMRTVRGMEMFEVRGGVDFGDAETVQIRVYHAEPKALRRTNGSGSIIVGVHLHHKVIVPGTDANDAQDAELQIARSRYFEGQKTTWGGAVVAKGV